MASTAPSRIWGMRMAFLGICLLIIFFHLLPLDTLPRRWAPPDLLLCLVFSWSVRRPDFVPVASVAGIMLLGDLLFHRPPGLLALLVVIGNEYMRRQSGHSRDMSFMGEWVTAAATITVITIANRLVLGATGVQQAALGLILIQMIMTVFAYPLVALVSQNLLGVRRLAPSDLDAMGVPR